MRMIETGTSVTLQWRLSNYSLNLWSDNMLARFTSLFLAGLILAQSFNIHVMDLLKLDYLLEHAQFHQSNYDDDIFSFLAKHYGDQAVDHQIKDPQKEGHDHEHEKLPFNHNYCEDALPNLVFNLNLYQLIEPVEHRHAGPNFYYQDSYSYLENVEIFQPPKLA